MEISLKNTIFADFFAFFMPLFNQLNLGMAGKSQYFHEKHGKIPLRADGEEK
jgi:hypothetical protein